MGGALALAAHVGRWAKTVNKIRGRAVESLLSALTHLNALRLTSTGASTSGASTAANRSPAPPGPSLAAGRYTAARQPGNFVWIWEFWCVIAPFVALFACWAT